MLLSPSFNRNPNRHSLLTHTRPSLLVADALMVVVTLGVAIAVDNRLPGDALQRWFTGAREAIRAAARFTRSSGAHSTAPASRKDEAYKYISVYTSEVEELRKLYMCEKTGYQGHNICTRSSLRYFIWFVCVYMRNSNQR